MPRDVQRKEVDEQGEEVIRDGSVVIEERMNRREGLVEYEGEGAAAGPAAAVPPVAPAAPVEKPSSTPAMQAGATILAGTGDAARVEEEPTVVRRTAPVAADRDTDSISMSNDNTAEGRLEGGTVEAGPIALVREGMRVVDADNEELGKVDHVRMGDPSAATVDGEGGDATEEGAFVVAAPAGTAGSGGGFGLAGGGVGLFGGGTDPAVEEPMRSQLMRIGYVKIDGKGWFDTDRYARADQIAAVTNDTVQLSVDKDLLPST